MRRDGGLNFVVPLVGKFMHLRFSVTQLLVKGGNRGRVMSHGIQDEDSVTKGIPFFDLTSTVN